MQESTFLKLGSCGRKQNKTQIHNLDQDVVLSATPPPILVVGLIAPIKLACAMGTKSRETLYGSTIRASAEKAKVARRHADVLAC